MSSLTTTSSSSSSSIPLGGGLFELTAASTTTTTANSSGGVGSGSGGGLNDPSFTNTTVLPSTTTTTATQHPHPPPSIHHNHHRHHHHHHHANTTTNQNNPWMWLQQHCRSWKDEFVPSLELVLFGTTTTTTTTTTESSSSTDHHDSNSNTNTNSTNSIPLMTWLLTLGPLAIVGKLTNTMGEALCFTCSGLALIPFAERLSFITEQVAEHTNGTIGALLNATFGNAPELLISVAALRAGYYRVVQLAMLGSILTNLVLVFGTACLIGGCRFQTQNIRSISGTVPVTLLYLATAGSVLPAALKLSGQYNLQHHHHHTTSHGHQQQQQQSRESNSHNSHSSSSSSSSNNQQASSSSFSNDDDLLAPTAAELAFCRVNAVVLLIAYLCFVLFQLKTHKEEYDDPEPSPHRYGNKRSRMPRRNLFCLSIYQTLQRQVVRFLPPRFHPTAASLSPTSSHTWKERRRNHHSTTTTTTTTTKSLNHHSSYSNNHNHHDRYPDDDNDDGEPTETREDDDYEDTTESFPEDLPLISSYHENDDDDPNNKEYDRRRRRQQPREETFLDDDLDFSERSSSLTGGGGEQGGLVSHRRRSSRPAPPALMNSQSSLPSSSATATKTKKHPGRSAITSRDYEKVKNSDSALWVDPEQPSAAAAAGEVQYQQQHRRGRSVGLDAAAGISSEEETNHSPQSHRRRRRRHSHDQYDVGTTSSEDEETNRRHRRRRNHHDDHHDHDDDDDYDDDDSHSHLHAQTKHNPSTMTTFDGHPLMSLRVGLLWLLIITVCISAMSDLLVDTIDGFAQRLHLSEVFTTMVIIPFFSNVAEQVSAFLFAYRNEMDLCVGVTIGSAIQVATFVLPGSVIVGYIMDRSMTLYFHGYETVCLFVSVVVVGAIVQGGTTNWMTGLLLMGLYVIMASGIWLHELESLTAGDEEEAIFLGGSSSGGGHGDEAASAAVNSNSSMLPPG